MFGSLTILVLIAFLMQDFLEIKASCNRNIDGSQICEKEKSTRDKRRVGREDLVVDSYDMEDEPSLERSSLSIEGSLERPILTNYFYQPLSVKNDMRKILEKASLPHSLRSRGQNFPILLFYKYKNGIYLLPGRIPKNTYQKPKKNYGKLPTKLKTTRRTRKTKRTRTTTRKITTKTTKRTRTTKATKSPSESDEKKDSTFRHEVEVKIETESNNQKNSREESAEPEKLSHTLPIYTYFQPVY